MGKYSWDVPCKAWTSSIQPLSNGGKNVTLDGVTYTPEYTLRHELGHAIFAMLARMNPEAGDELKAHLQLVANEYGEIDKKLEALKQKARSAYSKKELDKLVKSAETLKKAREDGAPIFLLK